MSNSSVGRSFSGAVLYPIAKNKEGKYVKITEARKGEVYFCPECGNRMIARKGKIRAWHFAHYGESGCSGCGGEGTRHAIAKHVIADHLSKIKRLPVYCLCGMVVKHCKVNFTDISTEEWVSDYRVDVSAKLNGKHIFIEVIDKNPLPDEKLRALMKKGDVVKVNIRKLTNDEIFNMDGVIQVLERELACWLNVKVGVKILEKYTLVHIWSQRCPHCGEKTSTLYICGVDPNEIPHDLLERLEETLGGRFSSDCVHCGRRVSSIPSPKGLLFDIKLLNHIPQSANVKTLVLKYPLRKLVGEEKWKYLKTLKLVFLRQKLGCSVEPEIVNVIDLGK